MKELQLLESDTNAPDMRGSLMVAKNAVRESYTQICDTPTPNRTRTHFPIPHKTGIDMLARRVQQKGWDITGASYASSYDRSNAHWVFQVDSSFLDGVTMEIAGHKSHIKMSSYMIYMAAKVHACTNRSVPASIPLRRKHTTHIMDELEGLIDDALDTLEVARDAHHHRILSYQGVYINNRDAHDLMIRCTEMDIVPATYLPTIISEWRIPNHEEFEDRTLWSLYNCFTESFKRSPASIPHRSQSLQEIFDHKAGITTSLNYARIGD